MLYSDYQNFIEKMIAGEDCLGYFRTSTDDQSLGFSFDYQEKLIKDYCAKMKMKPPNLIAHENQEDPNLIICLNMRENIKLKTLFLFVTTAQAVTR